MSGKRVMVVAWSAADWSVIHPAIDRGELPHLAGLVEGGVSGPLTTLAPLNIPIVATTLATGFYPPRHGVLGDMERRPDGGGVQPVGPRSWRAPAVWEHLTRAGLKTAVVNWPATQPAERWPGIVVDERFAIPEGQDFDAWPLPLHCVTPEPLREAMRDLRVHPGDIGAPELRALVPRLGEIDTRSDRRPRRLAVSLARAASVHAAATHIAEHEAWDFLLVRYALLADVWHDLHATPDDAGLYRDVMAGSYRLLDVTLGRLLELAGPDTTIFLVSAAGWRSAGMAISESADDAVTAYDKGLLVARGEEMKRDALIHRAASVDLTPTLLACFGLVAPGDGMVLDTLFAAGPPQTQAVPPAPPPAAPDGDPAAHLVALGYADRLSEASQQTLADAELTQSRNLADSCLALHRWDAARTVLQQILQQVPDDYLANLKLGRLMLLAGDAKAARAHAKAAMEMAPDLPWASLLMGSAHAVAGNEAEAEPHLARATQLGAALPGVNLSLGWTAALLQRWRDAERAFLAALAANANIAEAHAGLGVSLHAQGRLDEAEAELRRAIALNYDSPVAHFHLGQILFRRDVLDEAEASLRLAVAQDPCLDEARDLLARIEKRRGSPSRA